MSVIDSAADECLELRQSGGRGRRRLPALVVSPQFLIRGIAGVEQPLRFFRRQFINSAKFPTHGTRPKLDALDGRVGLLELLLHSAHRVRELAELTSNGPEKIPYLL